MDLRVFLNDHKMTTTKISLQGLEFFAYHGVYEEERKIGNKYSVDISVTVNRFESTDKINSTVNYEQLYKIALQEMLVSHKLLETIAEKLSDNILYSFSDVLEVEVTVSKFNPPVGGICYKATVQVSKNRK